jgi:hypothetical protein
MNELINRQKGWLPPYTLGSKVMNIKITSLLCRSEQILPAPGNWGYQNFSDSRHLEVIRLSALSTGRLIHPGDAPNNHFCQWLSRLLRHRASGRIRSMENFNDPVRNWTREHAAQCLNQQHLHLPCHI